EPVTDAGHRLDVALTGGLFAQRAAQRRDAVVQVVLFDDGIGPDAAHQLVFRQQPAGVFDQKSQRVEHLRAQSHCLAGAQKTSLAHVEAEVAEFIDRPGVESHFSELSANVHSGDRTRLRGARPNSRVMSRRMSRPSILRKARRGERSISMKAVAAAVIVAATCGMPAYAQNRTVAVRVYDSVGLSAAF